MSISFSFYTLNILKQNQKHELFTFIGGQILQLQVSSPKTPQVIASQDHRTVTPENKNILNIF